MKSSFAFLKSNWPILAELGGYAEMHVHSDPNTTLVKVRMFIEHTAKHILRLEGIGFDDRMPLSDMLRRLKREELLPYEIKEIFYTLKQAGNKAAHDGWGGYEDAQTALRMTYRVGLWLMEVYGTYQGPFRAEDYPFIPPRKRDLEGELEALRKEHEKLMKELALVSPAALPENTRVARKDLGVKAAGKIGLNEAETRKIIDAQLRSAGWEADSEVLRYGKGVRPETGRNMAVAEWPCGKEFVDYALFCGLMCVGVIEAKKWGTDVFSILSESRRYAEKITLRDELFGPEGAPWRSYRVPFLFSSNGRPYSKVLELKSGIWFDDVRESGRQPRALRGWFSPDDLKEMLALQKRERRFDSDGYAYLQDENGLHLHDYQMEAVTTVDSALAEGRTECLVAMATGTGKTRTAIGLVYHLLKEKQFRRVLFLVDRNSLGKQASDRFKDLKLEELKSFSQIYDVKELKDKTIEPVTKLHIATVQGMVRRILLSDDEEPAPTPGQYDLIVIDEAHRGYILDAELEEMEEEPYRFANQMDYLSKYRYVIEYFDAVKVALTATPALHTIEIFGQPVYTYSYRQAVIDGFLVDHEPPYIIKTDAGEEGITFVKGETVPVYFPAEERIESRVMEDEVTIDIEGFNKRVITEPFNRTVIRALADYIDPEGQEKTIIFCVNDEHADLVVKVAKEVFGERYPDLPDEAISKVTSYIKNQDEAIRRFRNEHYPTIAVTVDLLTTGIDVHAVCHLVFLRRVRSRILYDQMIGRATRLCPEIGKDHFTIYDAVGIYDLLQDFTDMKPVVQQISRSLVELADELATVSNAEEQKARLEELVARLRRKAVRVRVSTKHDQVRRKTGGMGIDEFIDYLTGEEPAVLIGKLDRFRGVFEYLDTESFHEPEIFIHEKDVELISMNHGYGENMKPEDYLNGFFSFVKENGNRIEALKILAKNPSRFNRNNLKALLLSLEEAGYSEWGLSTAWRDAKNADILTDVINLVLHAAKGVPVVDHGMRIHSAVNRVRELKRWNPFQMKWISRIEEQLLREQTLDQEDFNRSPFREKGGYDKIDGFLDGELEHILEILGRELYTFAA